MKRLSLVFAVSICAMVTNEAFAQELTWGKNKGGVSFPLPGTVNLTVQVQGKTTLSITKVLVWCYVNGSKKTKDGSELAVDLDGNWGLKPNGDGYNFSPPTTVKSSDTVMVIVQAVSGGNTYELSGSAKVK